MYLRFVNILTVFTAAVGFYTINPKKNKTDLLSRPFQEKRTNSQIFGDFDFVNKKKEKIRAKWFPVMNINAPEQLDGSLAGDVGFDPLGFSSSKKTLYWMREAEIKHSRLAMLGALGWPLSEVIHNKLADVLHLDSMLAPGDRAPSILNGGLSSSNVSGTLFFTLIITGYLESLSMKNGTVFWDSEKPDG